MLHHIRNKLLASYILNSIPSKEVEIVIPSHKKSTLVSQISKFASNLLISPKVLTERFRSPEFAKPNKNQISRSQQLFNSGKIKLEWSESQYDMIPDVRYRRLMQERLDKINNMDPLSLAKMGGVTPKKSFGIEPGLLRPLPEVLLLGNTNVGKSSLINTLFLDKIESKSLLAATEYAFVSRRAGYTKSLNAFNVAKKLRVVDTPGYGQFGEYEHGSAVIEYIQRRETLRTVFLLIDSVKGFQQDDLEVLDLLVQRGVSFDVVLTKVDEVYRKKVPKGMEFDPAKCTSDTKKQENLQLSIEANRAIIKHFDRLVKDSDIQNAPMSPRIFFTNSIGSKVLPKRYGNADIRAAIMQSCGLFQENKADGIEYTD